jgi:hypothetical protein
MSCEIRTLRRLPSSSPGARRFRANLAAGLRSGGRHANCRLIDISAEGAAIAAAGALDERASAWLIVNQVPMMAKVVWRKGDRVGLRFREPQIWLEEAHAKRFDPAAWLTAGES